MFFISVWACTVDAISQARSEAFTKDAKEKNEWTIAQDKARLLEHDKERKQERDDHELL